MSSLEFASNDQENQFASEAEAELSSLPSFDEHMAIDHPELQDSDDTEKDLVPRIQVIDMTKCHEGELSAEFTEGIYLFHSTEMDSAKKILESGALMNAGALHTRNLIARRAELEAEGASEEEIQEELKKVHTRQNSGNEGISWSCNGIDALTGDKGHIVGFLAAPETALGDSKLVVPSRPAPYEFLQVSESVDTKNFFEAKKQYEVWGYKDFSVFEKASVENGLVRLAMNIDHANEPDEYGFRRSLLKDYCNQKDFKADDLRRYFEVGEDGHIKIDEQLHQQKFDNNYLPPAAVYIQALIDDNFFSGTSCEGLDVAGVVNKAYEQKDLVYSLIRQSRQEGKYLSDKYDEELNKAQDVAVPVEQMYLVASPKDLDVLMETIEKSEHRPKGILLYDETKVVNPNFATAEKGDHKELSDEINKVVGADTDFWQREMGVDLESAPRAGSQGQVLEEKLATEMRKSEFRLVDGKLRASA